jgi:hypothetical protein
MFDAFAFIAVVAAVFFTAKVPIPPTSSLHRFREPVTVLFVAAAMLFLQAGFLTKLATYLRDGLGGYVASISGVFLIRLPVYLAPQSALLQWGTALAGLVLAVALLVYWAMTKCPRCNGPRTIGVRHTVGFNAGPYAQTSSYCPSCDRAEVMG